ncbi:MAG: LuxR C-terminal-related transcriptional regulator [Treponema sp.]|nr:LuxR C-terminal-related transcriptional regulator [Treponema sp.]
MAGGTLMISRAVKNHSHYKKRLEALGFPDVTLTALEKDALNSLIRNMKPNLVMMGARFYQGSTPFLMKELKQTFPKIKMAALCVGEYPADLAMYFILNGINSYVTSFDGIDQWYKGLDEISKGREWISPEVVERIDLRKEYPMPAGNITDRHKEVMRLICCGYKDLDIADVLHISRSTVDNHKTEIFTSLNIRNSNELMRAALYLKYVKFEEICFFPKGFTLNPKPDKALLKAATANIRLNEPNTIRRIK